MFKLSNYFIKQEEAGAEVAAGGGTPSPEAAPEVTPEVQPEATPEPAPPAEPEVAPLEEAEEFDTSEGYEDSFYGHAAEMFDNANLNGQPVVEYFEEHGEFNASHVEQMEKAMGKAQAAILLQGIKAQVAQTDAEVAENDAKIYEAVGGQENFEAAADWIRSEESEWTDEERDDINTMLDMGGNIGAWAAQLMMIDFNNAGNPTPKPAPAKPDVRDGHKAQASTPEQISIQDYNKGIKTAKTQSEVDELVKRANFTRQSKNAVDLGWKFG